MIIPNSEFKKQIEEFGLIKKDNNQTIKKIYNNYKKYEYEINNTNSTNIIIGEINIGPDDINKDIQIINSFENLKRINNWEDNKDYYKYENEKEIKENIEIKINEKKINFSYTYKFEKEGKYKIEYLFKNNITKTNYMFEGCKSLTNLDLSNFNTQNVTKMNGMFKDCNSLIKLNLYFNTQNVTDMSWMFWGCSSLTNINLSNFNTQNVTNMGYMFNGCSSLTNINLSNFNTQNVTYMDFMFSGCSSLTNINIITNDKRIINQFFKTRSEYILIL